MPDATVGERMDAFAHPGLTAFCRLDEIVRPGVDVNPGDFYIDPSPPITDKCLRRR
ncbi:hypothetical protein [Streptomyces xylophagus]|uniref:hypothetical protein n=1 Tax=Streptomyces xylophagus TaxID=285514 RepID=UPI000AC83DE3|nr:hypothetical protein [Streptomyces xylophagus]